MSSDDLENLPGVGPATSDKLVNSGYGSFEEIAVESPSVLANEADIGESTAQKAVQGAREEADLGGFETGVEVLERINEITTGVDDVDELLGGGVETNSMTEIYGEFGSGKSQLSHQLCVMTQLPPDSGGLGQEVIFIDTEDTFRPNRIEGMVEGLSDEHKQAMMRRFDIDGDVMDENVVQEIKQNVLDGISIAKAYNSSHQILMGDKTKEQAKGMEADVGLLIVDSLTAHFRAEYVGRGELAERQQKLNKHISSLKEFAELNEAAIFVTNQVSADPDSYFGDPTTAIGGNILAHHSTVRLYLKKSKGTKRIIRLEDSPDQPTGEAVMRIENEGIKPE